MTIEQQIARIVETIVDQRVRPLESKIEFMEMAISDQMSAHQIKLKFKISAVTLKKLIEEKAIDVTYDKKGNRLFKTSDIINYLQNRCNDRRDSFSCPQTLNNPAVFGAVR